jgi:hypothetical protein
MSTLAHRLIRFYKAMQPPPVPRRIEVMHPHPGEDVIKVVEDFFLRFYDDNRPRRLLLGINPGRFGAGITGINFTAPRQLREHCGIQHQWKDSSELSAEFIYAVIDAYGGPKKFYGDFFIGAVSPLGFTKHGKNINYYDEPGLLKKVTPFIRATIHDQLSMGFLRDTCFCIGGEKNFKFLSQLTEKEKYFDKIIPLAHPRFIMQYRRKKKSEYVKEWIELLQSANSGSFQAGLSK